MTKEQKSRLAEYLTDENVNIRTIEYPSGVTQHRGTTQQRNHLDTVKIFYHLAIPERNEIRGYIDWYDKHGWSVGTEYKGRIV
jgi:hypothetical protein